MRASVRHSFTSEGGSGVRLAASESAPRTTTAPADLAVLVAILARRVARIRTNSVSLSDKSRQSGMVQPVVNEMFATVHAAGSSLLGLFTSCTTFKVC
eukprot:scaffold3183_cov120-Isochrysis_galbana.AAC.6